MPDWWIFFLTSGDGAGQSLAALSSAWVGLDMRENGSDHFREERLSEFMRRAARPFFATR